MFKYSKWMLLTALLLTASFFNNFEQSASQAEESASFEQIKAKFESVSLPQKLSCCPKPDELTEISDSEMATFFKRSLSEEELKNSAIDKNKHRFYFGHLYYENDALAVVSVFIKSLDQQKTYTSKYMGYSIIPLFKKNSQFANWGNHGSFHVAGINVTAHSDRPLKSREDTTATVELDKSTINIIIQSKKMESDKQNCMLLNRRVKTIQLSPYDEKEIASDPDYICK